MKDVLCARYGRNWERDMKDVLCVRYGRNWERDMKDVLCVRYGRNWERDMKDVLCPVRVFVLRLATSFNSSRILWHICL